MPPSQTSEGPSLEDRAPPTCSHLHQEPREGWGCPGSGNAPLHATREVVGLRCTAPAPGSRAGAPSMHRKVWVSPRSGAHERQLIVLTVEQVLKIKHISTRASP